MKILPRPSLWLFDRLQSVKPIALFICLSFFFVLLIQTFSVLAETQGIRFVSQAGKEIQLYKDYHALVVGVGNYDKWPPLPNAVKDAREVSWLLRRLGFKVTLLTNPSSRELKKALNEFVQNSGQVPDRGLVFYYAGNGETQNLPDGTKLGWIIPRDCPLPQTDRSGFEKLAISTKLIEYYSQQIKSKHVLMFFDSSFSGEVFSLESPVLKVISENSALPVRQYLIAGRQDEPIPDQSMFKRSLVEALEGKADVVHDGYVTGSELGVYLADRVVKYSRGYQHPQYGKASNNDLARGDFVFDLTAKRLDISRLFVETNPDEATIKILNIKPRFYQGIELKPGKYLVGVSAPGHQTQKKWINLDTGEDRTIDVRLRKILDEFTNSLGLRFVYISPGSFLMGSSKKDPARLSDENEHQVTLTKPFFMQSTEVTVGQFSQFVKATGYRTESETGGGCWISAKGAGWKKKRGSSWRKPGYAEIIESSNNSLPVTCVTWNDAQAFIQWLSRKEGKTYRLPTEAEWEYASRAGTHTPFSYGNCLSTDQANYGELGWYFPACKGGFRVNRKKPINVGSLTPNPWKLFNMHGNVSEWCQDWYGSYPGKSVTNPQGPSSGTERVMRGGHWRADAQECRSAKRWRFPPNMAFDAVGFRLVMIP
jgi:formylglycine-generating enzyme required for sulfatase activity